MHFVKNLSLMPKSGKKWLLRRSLSVAGKSVSHGGKIILKFTSACFDNFRLSELVERCNSVLAIRYTGNEHS